MLVYPRLVLTLREVAGMGFIIEVDLTMATRDYLVKQGILPANLLK